MVKITPLVERKPTYGRLRKRSTKDQVCVGSFSGILWILRLVLHCPGVNPYLRMPTLTKCGTLSTRPQPAQSTNEAVRAKS